MPYWSVKESLLCIFPYDTGFLILMRIVKSNLRRTVIESLFEHIYVQLLKVFLNIFMCVFYAYERSVCMNACIMEEDIIQ